MTILAGEMRGNGRTKWPLARRFALGGAILLSLFALLFSAQGWIGARESQRFERELARRGLDLNWRHHVPAVPAADDNFYDALVVRAWFPPKGTVPCLAKDEIAPSFPALPNGWFPSAPVRLEELQNLPRTGEERSLSALAEHFDKLEPGLRMLREAALRPCVYLPGDYTSPESLPVPNFIAMRHFAQVLSGEARLHLLLGQGERAIQDLDTIQAVMRGLDSKPALLVSAMIRVAIAGLYVDVVRDGFQLEAWKGSDLPALRARLEKIDLIPTVVNSLSEGEMNTTCYLLKKMADDAPPERLRFLKYAGYGDGFRPRLLSFAPAGSIRRNVLLAADLLQEAPQIFASDGSRFYPKKMASAAERIGSEFGRMRLDNVLTSSFVPNFTKASTICARNQTLIRLGIVACALEEYRTIHGSYPRSLEELESANGSPLPRDLITGGLPIYRPGKAVYELYSVGPDEKDDGGSAADWVFTPGD